jgi:hypothetical protein
MRIPEINIFKKTEKAETAKATSGHAHHTKSAPAIPVSDAIFKKMPSRWVVLFAYVLAGIFCYLVHRFFLWFPPYLIEVFKNLKGLPIAWADLGLYWGEKGLVWIAITSAVYHNLWQLGTRYKLSSHDIQVQNWFPTRRVMNVPYGSVRKVGFQQSPTGFIFNYGQVEIDTGSPDGPLVLVNCPSPKAFLARLQPKVEAILQPNLTHHKRATDT